MPKPKKMNPAKAPNSRMVRLRGRYTAILAASCISHTAHNVPDVIHWMGVQYQAASPVNHLRMSRESAIHTMMAEKKATKYPPRLLVSMPVMPFKSVEKQLKMRKVVDTGIRRRVMISRKIGAAT